MRGYDRKAQRAMPRTFIETLIESSKSTHVGDHGPFRHFRRKTPRGTFHDFIEHHKDPAKYKIGTNAPIKYTYAEGTGRMSRGSEARYARQDVKGTRAGDVKHALGVARAHYDKYRPVTDPSKMQTFAGSERVHFWNRHGRDPGGV